MGAKINTSILLCFRGALSHDVERHQSPVSLQFQSDVDCGLFIVIAHATSSKIFIDHQQDFNMVVVDVNNLKIGRKQVKLQKESPAGCAGED